MRLIGSHWKDWQVWLEDSEGRRLNEYQIQYIQEGPANTRVARMHVEVKDSQEFGICVQPVTYPGFDWQFMPKVDGRAVAGLALNRYRIDKTKISTFYDMVAGSACERKLTFNKLTRIEDGPRLDTQTATQLGTIEVLIEGGTSQLRPGLAVPQITPAAHDTIDEKLKKVALSSYVGGGDVVGEAKPLPMCMLYRDPKIPPYKIEITYATRPILMLKDIIPNPPAVQEPPHAPRTAGAKKDKKIEELKDEKKVKQDKSDTKRKRRSSGAVGAEAGPSRIRLEARASVDDDDLVSLDTPSKKRKIHTVDLTTGRKPVFINLLDSDSEDEKPVIVL